MSDALAPFDHPNAPADVRGDLGALRAQLDQTIPRMRTIFDKDGDKASFYDQIAWFNEGKKAMLNMKDKAGGHFDFRPLVYRNLSLTLEQMSLRISDHYPLWIEFDLSN